MLYLLVVAKLFVMMLRVRTSNSAALVVVIHLLKININKHFFNFCYYLLSLLLS